MNPVVDCLMNHKSIRRFKSKPIEPEKLDLILKTGIRAATAGNLQQYSLIVVDDPEKKRALWDSPTVDAPTVILSVVDIYRLKRWFELNDAPFYFDQAVNVFIGFWDAVIALHNIVIAAESMALGAVYIGTILSVDLKKVLGTPDYVIPAGMALVGYPDESPGLRPRLPLGAVVHRNGYQIPSDDDIQVFFRERDEEWHEMPEDRRRQYQEKGITNVAQRTTVGHYTDQFTANESKAVLDNLKRAKFALGDG